MSIRTLKFAIQSDPANSRAIGHHAKQMNAAYNAAIDVLNREPELLKRSGKGEPDTTNKRITKWRRGNRQLANHITADPHPTGDRDPSPRRNRPAAARNPQPTAPTSPAPLPGWKSYGQ